MKTYTITLPDEIAAMADGMIARGHFRDMDHLVMYSVSRTDGEVRADENMTEEELEWLRREIQKGLDSSARGDVAPMDFDEIDREVATLLAAEEEAARATSYANTGGQGGHRGDQTTPVTAQ